MPDTNLPDGDYVLTDGAAWFSCDGFAIRIYTTHRGVVVNIYEDGKEMEAPIATTSAVLEKQQ